MKYLIKNKRRDTNTTVEAYMTARTMGKTHQFHISCVLVTRHEFNPHFVCGAQTRCAVCTSGQAFC